MRFKAIKIRFSIIPTFLKLEYMDVFMVFGNKIECFIEFNPCRIVAEIDVQWWLDPNYLQVEYLLSPFW